MNELKLTRRRFAGLAAAAAAAPAMDLRAGQAGRSGRSASDIVNRLAERSGVAPPDRTVDGFKAGDGNAAVRGIAVTSMATIEVLRKAAQAGLNLVLSFEPTFFGRSDGQPAVAGAAGGPGNRSLAPDDPVLLAKHRFVQSSGLVVYRFHDQWAGRRENEHAGALADAMGWTHAAGPDSVAEYLIAPTPLAQIVTQARTKLRISGGMRVVGNRDARIRHVTVLPGVNALATLLARLPATDLLLVGETRDWEGPEYVGDAATAGLNKGMISVGKVVSAEPGMRACAAWVRSFISDVPVQWLPAGDPYWRPA